MKNFNKIVLVSLCNSFTRKIGIALSKMLEMMFCDAADLLQYQLADMKTLEKVWDKTYLNAQEKKVMQQVSSFENVVVSINFDLFQRHSNVIKPNAAVVFVELPKEYIKKNGDKIDVLAYQARTQKLKSLADASFRVIKDQETFVCNKIINCLSQIV